MTRLRLLLFFFSFTLFVFFCSGTIDSQDGFQYLAVARNMYYLHRPIAPPPEFPEKNVYMNVTKAADGSYYSPTGAGYSIAMIPAVALSDLLHRVYHVPVPVHFPLETDWAVLLFASFTNAFFAALLVVIIFDYLLLLGSTKRTALLGALLTILATNLFPIAKESFAQMMYITFLVGSFYFVKKYSLTRRLTDIASASACFGIMMSAYNPIFILTVLPLVTYYFLCTTPRLSLFQLKQQIKPIAVGIASGIPFVLFYLWYNAVRTGTAVNSGYGLPAASNFKANFHILYEGLFGLLFSPGRGFFLYSPVLLILILFWHKIPYARIKSELIAFTFLAISNIYFFAIQNGGPDWYQWNGESSWGPRYIALLIPFAMLVVISLVAKLSKRERRLVLYPLIAVSLFVQALGVFIPYQIKFNNLTPEFRLNGVRMTTSDYANFIPRYSPLINMPRELAKRFIEFPATRRHGEYNVRFLDGFDYPYRLGNQEVWRGIHSIAYFTMNAPRGKPVTTLDIGFSNTRLDSSSSHSAYLVVRHGDQVLASSSAKPDTWGELHATTSALSGTQELTLESGFIGTSSAKQVVFIRTLSMNDTPISLKSIDLPYVQPLASAMTGAKYKYFGKIETNPWYFWSMHSSVYEGTFDLWWIKVLYYWDLPRPLFGLLFALDAIICSSTCILLWEKMKTYEKKS